jgi:hypothetical protein
MPETNGKKKKKKDWIWDTTHKFSSQSGKTISMAHRYSVDATTDDDRLVPIIPAKSTNPLKAYMKLFAQPTKVDLIQSNHCCGIHYINDCLYCNAIMNSAKAAWASRMANVSALAIQQSGSLR